MKVELKIDDKYIDPEIHVCNNEDNSQIRQLKKTVEDAIGGSITAMDDDKTVIVMYSDIVRFYSANKNVYVTTMDATYRVRDRLYELEARLDATKFVRISNSEIINVSKLIKLDTNMTGTIKMYLKGNQETYVSRRYVPKIKKALGVK